MSLFTVFVREASEFSTETYITSVFAEDIEDAKRQALKECSDSWGGDDYPVSDLYVVGVAKGDVEILEWDDQE